MYGFSNNISFCLSLEFRRNTVAIVVAIFFSFSLFLFLFLFLSRSLFLISFLNPLSKLIRCINFLIIIKKRKKENKNATKRTSSWWFGRRIKLSFNMKIFCWQDRHLEHTTRRETHWFHSKNSHWSYSLLLIAIASAVSDFVV